MATPAVAGAAASVLASGTARTPADVRSRLVATARPTSAGPRLDVAAAVGYVPPAEVAELAVTLAGADRLVPDTASTLTWTVVTRDPSSAVALRLSVAARDGGTIGAVGGLDTTFRTTDRSTSARSSPTSTVSSHRYRGGRKHVHDRHGDRRDSSRCPRRSTRSSPSSSTRAAWRSHRRSPTSCRSPHSTRRTRRRRPPSHRPTRTPR